MNFINLLMFYLSNKWVIHRPTLGPFHASELIKTLVVAKKIGISNDHICYHHMHAAT